ncbi:DUF6285 domain-containing protein [Plastoroseomonas hellenica]|uniref:DUF6285 domain-containing protein n=1 Tax=Plastoroseomonas hellenica TaxID=2687306 RepID=UPI001BA9C261|nr:DUF6285 domain-containing protein [Plastoroseomonas hellenica]MBR0645460.1 hypothetical protein [Plastoroseomonas hellenica]
MHEQPDGAALLEAARGVLLEELLPHLPEGLRFAARMVANAMAIAAREARQDGGRQAECLAAVAALTGPGDAPLAAFAKAIRAGGFDPGTPQHAAAAAALMGLARARCAVSAPKALAESPFRAAE